MNQPLVINKKTAVRGSFCFLLLIGTIAHQASLQKWQGEISASQRSQNEQKDREKSSRDWTKSMASESSIALDRVKAGCNPIVLTQNNRPSRMRDDMRVFDAQTFPENPKIPRFDKLGNPINGVQPLPSGLTVCNAFGDTAIVGVEGYIEDIARVQPSKLKEFMEHYQKSAEVRSR